MSTRDDALTGIVVLCIDSADPSALAAWWQSVIGGRVEIDDDGDARLVPPGAGWPLDFLRVPDARQVKNRLHLDLGSTDFDRAVERAIELGATPADDVYDGGRWKVLRDPEGNEFCILRPGGESFERVES